jgi:hypothetical protein
MAVTVKNTVFWDVMLFSMVEITSILDETAASILKPMLEGSHNRRLRQWQIFARLHDVTS